MSTPGFAKYLEDLEGLIERERRKGNAAYKMADKWSKVRELSRMGPSLAVDQAAKSLNQPTQFGLSVELSEELREDDIYKLMPQDLQEETKRVVEQRAGLGLIPQLLRPKRSLVPPSPKKKPAPQPISETRVIILED